MIGASERRVLPPEEGLPGPSGRFTAEELAELALRAALGPGWRSGTRVVLAGRRVVVECDLLADAMRLAELLGTIGKEEDR